MLWTVKSDWSERLCPRCRGKGVPEREDNSIELEEGRLEEVGRFNNHLGDELECKGGVELAIRGRISASWLKDTGYPDRPPFSRIFVFFYTQNEAVCV